MRIDFPDAPDAWRSWFAWRPVLADYDGGIALCWLTRVERRPYSGMSIGSPAWEYRVGIEVVW